MIIRGKKKKKFSSPGFLKVFFFFFLDDGCFLTNFQSPPWLFSEDSFVKPPTIFLPTIQA